MKHPRTRAERRHERNRLIAKRRFIFLHIWAAGNYGIDRRNNPLSRHFSPQLPEFGKYAKWNLGCGSPLCHCMKYFGPKRKRRVALKGAAHDEVDEY